MSIIQNILKSFFGDKSSKDIKKMMPTVEKIKAEYAKLADISNDELRALTTNLRQELKDAVKDEEDRLQGFKDRLNGHEQLSIKEQEQLYNDIEKLEKNIQDILKEKLDAMLPQAFAIIKETAHRFAEHENVEVTATDMDRELATRYENITINGDKAIYSNTWEAGGNKLTWNMVHYDVQLIGGIALHQGKIAEMATGEGKTLVATLPVFLNALTGRGVHVVTVNDYLANATANGWECYTCSRGLLWTASTSTSPTPPQDARHIIRTSLLAPTTSLASTTSATTCAPRPKNSCSASTYSR